MLELLKRFADGFIDGYWVTGHNKFVCKCWYDDPSCPIPSCVRQHEKFIFRAKNEQVAEERAKDYALYLKELGYTDIFVSVWEISEYKWLLKG